MHWLLHLFNETQRSTISGADRQIPGSIPRDSIDDTLQGICEVWNYHSEEKIDFKDLNLTIDVIFKILPDSKSWVVPVTYLAITIYLSDWHTEDYHQEVKQQEYSSISLVDETLERNTSQVEQSVELNCLEPIDKVNQLPLIIKALITSYLPAEIFTPSPVHRKIGSALMGQVINYVRPTLFTRLSDLRINPFEDMLMPLCAPWSCSGSVPDISATYNLCKLIVTMGSSCSIAFLCLALLMEFEPSIMSTLSSGTAVASWLVETGLKALKIPEQRQTLASHASELAELVPQTWAEDWDLLVVGKALLCTPIVDENSTFLAHVASISADEILDHLYRRSFLRSIQDSNVKSINDGEWEYAKYREQIRLGIHIHSPRDECKIDPICESNRWLKIWELVLLDARSDAEIRSDGFTIKRSVRVDSNFFSNLPSYSDCLTSVNGRILAVFGSESILRRETVCAGVIDELIRVGVNRVVWVRGGWKALYAAINETLNEAARANILVPVVKPFWAKVVEQPSQWRNLLGQTNSFVSLSRQPSQESEGCRDSCPSSCDENTNRLSFLSNSLIGSFKSLREKLEATSMPIPPERQPLSGSEVEVEIDAFDEWLRHTPSNVQAAISNEKSPGSITEDFFSPVPAADDTPSRVPPPPPPPPAMLEGKKSIANASPASMTHSEASVGEDIFGESAEPQSLPEAPIRKNSHHSEETGDFDPSERAGDKLEKKASLALTASENFFREDRKPSSREVMIEDVWQTDDDELEADIANFEKELIQQARAQLRS